MGEIAISEKQKVDFFRKAINIFEENNINYWLECGTLLGQLRDGRFLAWDPDIDVATTCLELNNVIDLKHEFNKKSMVLEKKPSGHVSITDDKLPKEFHIDVNPLVVTGDYFIYTYIGKQSMISSILDIFYHAIHYKTPEKSGSLSINSMKKIITITNIIPEEIAHHLSNVLGKAMMFFRYKKMFFFKSIKTKYDVLYGIKIRIPVDAEEHIQLLYGSSWRIPDRYNHGSDEFKNYRIGAVTVCKQ